MEINYYNKLVDITSCKDIEENFKQSLKFNKYGLELNKILNTWRFMGIKFEINSGFDYSSKDTLIASFRKISLKISEREYNKLTNIDEFNVKYDNKKEILTLVI